MRITSWPHRRAQVAVGMVIGMVAMSAVFALAACGTNAPEVGNAVASSSFDKQLHDRLPADIRRAGVVRIGTDASYAPASFFAQDGRTIVGFEPDLAAALEQTLGIRIKMINIDFTDALPLVEAGRVDAVMSAMTDTAERRARVDFIDYFSAGTAILVQRGNPHGISDLSGLCGAVVAVEEGTTQVDMLKRAQPACGREPIEIQTYPTNSDALLQLRTGRAVAVLNDYPPAVYATTGAKTRNHFQLASTTQYEPGAYGIAIAKDRPQLRDVLFDAMAKMIRSGSYAEILHRWSVSDGALASITINGGSTAPPNALPKT